MVGTETTNKPYLNGDLDADQNGFVDEEDDKDTALFLEAISRIEQLEKMKDVLDERESKLKANLRARYEEEKAAMKTSSDLLVEKECLRDELIRLKDAREKLIDELQVLKSVDEEMSAFNRLNESFNENLKKHIRLIEEKQARIYTLKPIITGTHVEVTADFDDKESVIAVQKAIQELIRTNITKVKDEIKRVCEDNGIHTNDEWTELIQEEKQAKQRIRQLKQKIRELQKRVTNDAANEDSLSVSGKRGNKRSADDEMECEGCGQSFPTEDQERFAYHCFRGCSKLEDYLKQQGRDVTVDCRECGETISSFMSFHDHLKSKHGYDSADAETKSSQGRTSDPRSAGKKRR